MIPYDWNIVIAVDFDNTLTEGSTFAGTGKISHRALRWIALMQKLGAKMVLWTTREGDDLQEALLLLEEHGVSFDYVNEYPLRNGGRKVNADMYIDDKANDGRIRWLRTYMRARRLINRNRRKMNAL